MAFKKYSALTERSMRTVEKDLSQSCSIMAQLIATHGPCLLATREFRPFQTLATSIISQQLSSKAAGTIKQRVLNLVPNFTPSAFLGVSADVLRSAGLSSAKSRYILEMANRINDGRLNFSKLVSRPDEYVIATLTELPGIGRWTAEMFLIFSLRRPNVLAVDDVGLQRATRLLYGDNAELKNVGQKWRPYCSVASWYLWRFLDSRK